MTIHRNVCAAARNFDQEQSIGPLEGEMLGALEQHDQTHAAWDATKRKADKVAAKPAPKAAAKAPIKKVAAKK